MFYNPSSKKVKSIKPSSLFVVRLIFTIILYIINIYFVIHFVRILLSTQKAFCAIGPGDNCMFGEGVTRFHTFSHLTSNLVTPVPNDHERVLTFRDPNLVPRTTISIWDCQNRHYFFWLKIDRIKRYYPFCLSNYFKIQDTTLDLTPVLI